MAIRIDGWPVAEGMVMQPKMARQWPIATQVVLLPFEAQQRPEPVNIDVLQVVLVPRGKWVRLLAHVPADVLEREGVQHG